MSLISKPRISLILLFSSLLALTHSQQIDTRRPENHPRVQTHHCTHATGCTPLNTTRLVIEANQRELVDLTTGLSCYNSTGSGLNTTICSDAATCASKCGWSGVSDYATKGVRATGGEFTMDLWTKDGKGGRFEGPRIYLMGGEDKYQFFKLKGQEFSYDVDVSKLSCGLNGALYFVSMAEDGGASFAGNKAGAAYGTGYCDAQCPNDPKFINGKANLWNETSKSPESGFCCGEMDIWEANAHSTAFTPHVCTGPASTIVPSNSALQGASGVCDKAGCDYNPFRLGQRGFYGPGANFTLDTSKKFKVVTQFHTDRNGDLSEIRRFYVQNGKVIANPKPAGVSGLDGGNSITDKFCAAEGRAFGGSATDPQTVRGGMKKMGQILDEGMVLAMSIWVDYGSAMTWLDSVSGSGPGAVRGPCGEGEGFPAAIEKKNSAPRVTFGAIKWGDFGSTFDARGEWYSKP